MVEDLTVQQVAPVVVLKRPHRGVHPECGGPIEVATDAGTQVLDTPPVIGAEQVVALQGSFVGVQCQVDGQVTVGMQRHLPAGRRGFVQNRVEFGAGVVHRLRPAGFRRIDPRHLSGLGAQVGKRDADVAHPG